MRRITKWNHWVATFAISFGLLFSMASPAFAYTYNLDIPTPYLNSMQSTELEVKESATTPYVQPEKRTIATNYFLSTIPRSYLASTNVITKSNTGYSSFTWQSGFGGIGTSYCLSAYPNTTGPYDAYNVSGKWSN